MTASGKTVVSCRKKQESFLISALRSDDDMRPDMHAFMNDAVQAFLPEGMKELVKILRLKDEQVAFCPDADASARIQPKQLCRAQRHRIGEHDRTMWSG